MAKLLTKAIAGFVFLMLVQALALFLPAGSVHFWQAWVYLAVSAACTILITAYLAKYDPKLLASRVKGGPTAERQRSQQIIQGLAGIFYFGLFVVSGLDFRFHWSAVSPLLSGIADGFVVVGNFIIYRVFKENSYTSATIEVGEGQTVITSGPYGVVRHPMYAGAILMLLVTPPALGSWVGLVCLAPLILAIIVRLLEEERFLRANLDGYAVYCRQVRYRLVPGIW
ncbi:MAG TPA: isoprenylcysteine carboxylmethyltransferase family protein [Armatimonadota bacterium]|jgi:protein-S-isoprenylcysteine O-methyltransferase Ste14